jgi:hypothetical protein
MLERTFSGQSALLFHHAMLIVLIRREIELEQALTEFFRVWAEQGDFLLQELDLRWLKSACDTLVDHGRTPAERSVAVAGSILVNVVKLYETERQVEDIPAAMSGRQYRRSMLFEGLKTFKIGRGDMVRNLAQRVRGISGVEQPAGTILAELFKRMHRNDTVFQRALIQNRDPAMAWADLPTESVISPAASSAPQARRNEDAPQRKLSKQVPRANDTRGEAMDIDELVARIARRRPEVLSEFPEHEARSLVRAVLEDFAAAIDATREGVVRLAGLGQFRVRSVEREVGGKRVVKRRVAFRSERAR